MRFEIESFAYLYLPILFDESQARASLDALVAHGVHQPCIFSEAILWGSPSKTERKDT